MEEEGGVAPGGVVHLLGGVGAPADCHLSGHVVVPGVASSPVVPGVEVATSQGRGTHLSYSFDIIFLLKNFIQNQKTENNSLSVSVLKELTQLLSQKEGGRFLAERGTWSESFD